MACCGRQMALLAHVAAAPSRAPLCRRLSRTACVAPANLLRSSTSCTWWRKRAVGLPLCSGLLNASMLSVRAAHLSTGNTSAHPSSTMSSFSSSSTSTTSSVAAADAGSSRLSPLGAAAPSAGRDSLSEQLLKTVHATGADQQQQQEEQEDRRRRESSYRAMKYTLATLGLLGTVSCGWAVLAFGSPTRDPDGDILEDEFSSVRPVMWQYMRRAWRQMNNYNQMLKDPSRDLLLPEPLAFPYQQPRYTLVLEMTGVLVHPDWTYRTGWRFKKRPAVSFLLQQVGPPLFEVVIYTNEQGFTASPIVEALDPNGYIMYRLYKDSTRYLNKAHVKDLNCLNRDLSKVIIVDWDEKAVQLNPRNQLRLARWNGEDDDTGLVDLAMLLKAIATSGVEDVREVMDHYRQYDDPLQAFRDNQRLLMEQENHDRQVREHDDKKSSLLRNSSGWVSSLTR